jgi:hypothetical protein
LTDRALSPLEPGALLGPYRIVSPLGAGGMGEVFRARDEKLDRDVAIKVLPGRLLSEPDALARFEREAKAVASLSHPNILAIFEFGEAGGRHYAVTELLEGQTLRELVAASPLPPKKATEYGRQIAEGLAAAHEKGIVHRRAFERPTGAETMTAILREDVPPLTSVRDGVPPALERVVEHRLEKRPEDRFQSARDLAFALGGSSSVSGRSATAGAEARHGRRRPAWAAVGAAALVGLLGGALLHRQLAGPAATPRLPEVRYLTYSGHDYTVADSSTGVRPWAPLWTGGGRLVFSHGQVTSGSLAGTASRLAVLDPRTGTSSLLHASPDSLGRLALLGVNRLVVEQQTFRQNVVEGAGAAAPHRLSHGRAVAGLGPSK